MKKFLKFTLSLISILLFFNGCGGGGNTSNNDSSSNSSNIDNVTIDPQAYYIDAVNGNDNNDGKTPQTAWKSLTKLNSIKINAGNKLLFRTGQTWEGELIIKKSGTADNPIEIGAYGDGSKPIIKAYGLYRVGMTNEETWHRYKDSYVGKDAKDDVKDPDNTWYFYSQALEAHPRRVKINGEEVLGAYYGGELDTAHKWHYNIQKSGQVFFYYGNTPPNEIETNLHSSAISLDNVSHIIINSVELQGGYIAALFIDGGSDIKIKNCTLGEMSGQGIYVKGDAHPVTGVIIDQCQIDSHYTLDYSTATGPDITDENGFVKTPTTRGAPEGVMFWGSVKNSIISNNYIKNWTHANINMTADNGEALTNNEVFNNTLTAPDIAYGGRIGLDGKNAANNYFHNNIITDIKSPIQFNGHDNRFQNNQVTDIKQSPLKPAETGNAIIVQAYTSPVYNITITNNTFKNIAKNPAIIISDNNNFAIDNIIISPNTYE